MQLQDVLEVKRGLEGLPAAPPVAAPPNQLHKVQVHENECDDSIQDCIDVHGSDSEDDEISGDEDYRE